MQMTNEKFKRIKEANQHFTQFLLDIGFTKTEGNCPMSNDAKYKYLIEDEIDKLELGEMGQVQPEEGKKEVEKEGELDKTDLVADDNEAAGDEAKANDESAVKEEQNQHQ